MARKLLFFLFAAVLFISLGSPIFPPAPGGRAAALEKIKLGTSVRLSPNSYLPVLAAEEKGFWKENGLEVEWVPFSADMPHMQGVAAGAIKIGYATSSAPLLAAARGLPVVMVAELISDNPWRIWVKTDSPYRHPRDLKGARIALTRRGSVMDALIQIVAKAHGIEKDVRIVAAGGVAEYVAAIKAGAVEAVIGRLSSMAGLKLEGVVRELVNTSDYLPKPWFENVVYAQKDFARSQPDVVRKVIGATLQSVDFIRKNPSWSIDKIVQFQGFSYDVAKLVYPDHQFTVNGKIDRKAVENIMRLYIEYGILPKEKTPAVDALFTNEYLPG